MEWVRLGDIVKIIKGKKVEESTNESEKSIRYIQIEDLRNDDNLKYTEDSKAITVNKEHILIAWDGANAGTIGFNLEGAIGSTISALEINELYKNNFSSEFLGYYLRSKNYYLKATATGATIPHISRSALLKLKIPIINIEYQQKIVEVLKKLEELINIRKEQIKAYDNLIESLFFEMFNHLKVKETSLKKYIKFSKNSVSDFSDYLDENYIGVENIEKETGRILKVEKVSDSNIKSSKNYFTRDDVLYSRIRPNLNKVALPDFDGLVSSEVFVINCGSEINKFFLTYTLRSKKFVTYAMLNSSGANFPRVNKKTIESYKIKVPPIELQNKFADYVIKIEEEKKKLNSSLKELENLFDALMQDAFSGNLFKDWEGR